MFLEMEDLSTMGFESQRNISRRQTDPALAGAPVKMRDLDGVFKQFKRMAKFESQDFDAEDSELEHRVLTGRTKRAAENVERMKWATSAIIGFVMGILAFIVDQLIKELFKWKLDMVEDIVKKDRSDFWKPFNAYMLISLSLACVAGGLVSLVEPLAAGSGIPELKTYLNGIHIPRLLRFKTLIVKLGGIAFTITSGLIAGKEGPFVHGGGLVGGGISQMTIFGIDLKYPYQFRNHIDKRDFIAIGTAAGVATAFGAPIGGMLFAVEEGASFYNTGILWQGFLATSIGVLTVHTLYQLREETEAHIFQTHFGVFREFGLYNDNQALYPIHFWWYVWEIPIFIVMGCWQGLTGAGFVRAYAHIVTPLRQRYIPVTKPLLRLVEVLFLAFVTGLIVFLLTYYSACKDLPTSLSSANKCITGSVLHQDLGAFLEQGEIRDVTEITDMYYKQWFCPANQYSVMGQLFLGPLSRSLKLLLHLGELQPEGFVLFDLFTLGTFYVVVYVLMVWTYGAGCAMGLFVPTLAMGAAYGHLVVRALISILDALNMSHVHPSPHTYAVIGAAGSLGGATRMTISITVLVMETTGSLQLIVPIMFTIFFSKWIGDQFSEGIYDAANMIRGVPFLIEHKASSMRGRTFVAAEKLKVNEVMSGGSAHPMVTLQPILMVKDLTEVLARCNHGGFPVTLDSPTHSCPEFRLQGLITRDRILKMLEHRIGFVTHGENHCPLPTSHCECVELLKKLGTTPFKPLPLEDLRSKLADCTSLMVDLRPFMQKHPFIIHNNMYLSRAYKLFRTMGLRHLFVTAEHHPKVVGCLTRKDVIEEHAKLALANKIDPEVVDLLPHLGGFLNGKGHRKQRRNGVGETSLAGSTNPVNYDDVTLELQSLRQSGDYANVETMSLSSISELERSNRMVSEDRDPFESSSKESSENETEWVPALRLPQLNRKSKVEIIDSKNKR